MSWLVRLYPPAWRRRYGPELEALLATEPASFRTAIDLVAGAADAWLNPQSSTAPGAADPKGDAMVSKMLKLKCAAGVVAAAVPLQPALHGPERALWPGPGAAHRRPGGDRDRPRAGRRLDQLVEIAPQFDGPGQITALLAANLMFELLCVIPKK